MKAAILLAAMLALVAVGIPGAHGMPRQPSGGVAPTSSAPWTSRTVCGATTYASGGTPFVQPGPACSPNPPDINTYWAVLSATSPQTGDAVFWATGWETAVYQMTWEFDNNTGKWINDTATTGSVHPDTGSNSYKGCLVWDPVAGDFLGVEGFATTTEAGTWTFAAHKWTNATHFLPDFGGDCTLSWDYFDNEAVLYYDSANASLPYTWVWTGATWSDITGTSGITSLGCLSGASSAWDSHDQEVIITGGETCATSTWESWTWAFRTGVWTNLTSGLSQSPPAEGSTGGVLLDGIAGVSGGVLLAVAVTTSTQALEFWFFLGGVWSQISVAADPTYGSVCQRANEVMGAVGNRTAMIFGGGPFLGGGGSCESASTTYFNDTWDIAGPPSPPGNGTTIHPVSFGCGSVLISWTNGPAPAGSTLVNVTIYLYSGYTTSTTPVQTISTNGATTSLQLNNLGCNARYTWQVQDWYSTGAPGPISGAFEFTTDGAVASSPVSCSSCTTAVPSWWWALVAVVLLTSIALVLVFVHLSGRRRGGREVA